MPRIRARGLKIFLIRSNIGAHFSDEKISAPSDFSSVLPFAPQVNETEVVSDTASWHLVSGYFTANQTPII